MTENASQEAGSAPQSQPASLLSKYVFVVVVLVLMVIIGWLFPAYKKVTKEKDALAEQVQKYQESQIQNSETETYYPTGKLASKTVTSSRQDVSSQSDTISRTRDYSQTITKRGMFTVTAYVNLDKELAVSATYQALGPIGVGVMFAEKPYVGLGLSF